MHGCSTNAQLRRHELHLFSALSAARAIETPTTSRRRPFPPRPEDEVGDHRLGRLEVSRTVVSRLPAQKTQRRPHRERGLEVGQDRTRGIERIVPRHHRQHRRRREVRRKELPSRSAGRHFRMTVHRDEGGEAFGRGHRQVEAPRGPVGKAGGDDPIVIDRQEALKVAQDRMDRVRPFSIMHT